MTYAEVSAKSGEGVDEAFVSFASSILNETKPRKDLVDLGKEGSKNRL
jgi:hypothetical protein